MKRFLVLCSLFLLAPVASRAASPIYLSEIAWAGSNSSTSDEWFELCGPAGTDLSGWSIEGAGTGGTALSVPEGSAVPASGAFLISNYADGDAKSTLAAAPDWVTTAVALSNSALFLTLRDAGGAVIDSGGVSGGAPLAGTSGTVKASMERLLPLQDGGLAEAWAGATASVGFDAGASELGTPGNCPSAPVASEPAEQALPAIVEPEPAPAVPEDVAAAAETPIDSATEASAIPLMSATGTPAAAPILADASPNPPTSAVRISEAYPAPNAGETEWIELVNPSDTGEILDGWTIEDGKGTPTRLSGTLLAWSRAVIASPKGQLNNDGDLILLKDASGRVIDGVAYGVWDSAYPNVGVMKKGEALMRVELQDAFAITTTPTPGEANVLTPRPAPAVAPKPETVAADPQPIAPAAVISSPTIAPPAVVAAASAPQAVVPAVAVAAVTAREAAAASTVKKDLPVVKKPAGTAPAAAKYKGDAYAGVIASPLGIYSKTRLYALIGGGVREIRLSASTSAIYAAGQRVTFVAQTKSEGGDPYLLANPNSFRAIDASASATFATVDAWPESAGAYRLNAEVVSLQSGVVEAKLGGVEGDILAPATLTASLKPGDIITIEGYVSPGPRPRTVLARPEALTLFKAFQAEAPASAPPPKLPWQAAAALTLFMALVGTYAYLRHQRLRRLELVMSPFDAGEDA